MSKWDEKVKLFEEDYSSHECLPDWLTYLVKNLCSEVERETLERAADEFSARMLASLIEDGSINDAILKAILAVRALGEDK